MNKIGMYFIFFFLLFCANVYATDTFNGSNGYLTLDSVDIDGVQYNNVVVQLLNVNVISVGSSQPISVSQACSASNFTNANYLAISEGMTLKQVEQIIGCDINPSETESMGNNMTAYNWINPDNLMEGIEVIFDEPGDTVSVNMGDFYKEKLGF